MSDVDLKIVADRLVVVAETALPLSVLSSGDTDDWRVVGPGLVAAVSVVFRALVGPVTDHQEIVDWSLSRQVVEYATTFAWIAADPEERVKEWLRSDIRERLATDKSFSKVGDPLLSAKQRTELQRYLDGGKQMPDMFQRAVQADSSWGAHLARELPEVYAGLDGFERLYRYLYRGASSYLHPTAAAIQLFVEGRAPNIVIRVPLGGTSQLAIPVGVLALALSVAREALPELRIGPMAVMAAFDD